MENLTIHSPHFITHQGGDLTVDVLGGVDLSSVERLICTLRITYKSYPPIRATLDLYNDDQSDRLIRRLCDKWELKLIDVSKSIHGLTMDLETYKLNRLKYSLADQQALPEMTLEEKQQAKEYLCSEHLLDKLQEDLNKAGVLASGNHLLILFMSMASVRSERPFSVLCFDESSGQLDNLIHNLSQCMPQGQHSYHTHISENALYYFDNHLLEDKVLFIGDMDCTQKMLGPLSALQVQGNLVKTRATKYKDGMLHSTTFRVKGSLCLIARASKNKTLDSSKLPFLSLAMEHHPELEAQMMEFNKELSAGLIDTYQIDQIKQRLSHLIASLEPIKVVNPFAHLIELPKEVPNRGRALVLLLNFIQAVTYFHQYTREVLTNEQTGEQYIESHPDDVALGFELLKDVLFETKDELAKATRVFYTWLQGHIAQEGLEDFTALDIRKHKHLHPRSLNRYLQELVQFHYLTISGGNKHRGGYRYQLTSLKTKDELENPATREPADVLKNIKQAFSRTVGQNPLSNSQNPSPAKKVSRTQTNQKLNGTSWKKT